MVNHQKFLNKKLVLPQVKSLSDEWAVLQFLKDWRASDIELAVRKDVDLEELILGYPNESKPIGLIAFGYDPSPWTIKEILYWFSIRRPDLYPVLATKDGHKWIDKHWRKRMRIKKTLMSSI